MFDEQDHLETMRQALQDYRRHLGHKLAKQDKTVCRCEWKDLANGHALDCPERGKTLAKWQKPLATYLPRKY